MNYDLFITIGDINLTGASQAYDSGPEPLPGCGVSVLHPRTGSPSLPAIDDPIQQTLSQTLYPWGSMWPTFANTWLNTKGRPVCLVGAGRNGQGLLNAWKANHPYVDDAVTKLNDAVSLLTANGDTFTVRGVIFLMGSDDGRLGVTQSAWHAAAVAFRDRLRLAFGIPTLQFFVISIDDAPSWHPEQVAGYAAIRAAQVDVCASEEGFHMVCGYQNFNAQSQIDPGPFQQYDSSGLPVGAPGPAVPTAVSHLMQPALCITGAIAATNIAALVA